MGKRVCCLHDMRIGPENAILMEIIRGIEPEAVSLFSAGTSAAIAINVCLDPPIFASYVTQELEVNFIMVLLEYVTIRHLLRKETDMI